mmetsp:Transcript_16103/g.45814  ORF Transcript_16103/g.45814 Transcript_16103/m.45814 type:complete len:151 (-) Transcript_16103:707-1159(-)
MNALINRSTSRQRYLSLSPHTRTRQKRGKPTHALSNPHTHSRSLPPSLPLVRPQRNAFNAAMPLLHSTHSTWYMKHGETQASQRYYCTHARSNRSNQSGTVCMSVGRSVSEQLFLHLQAYASPPLCLSFDPSLTHPTGPQSKEEKSNAAA